MLQNSKKSESNNKNAQPPWKHFPKSYFTQSIVTISRNPSENDSLFFFARAMFSEWRVIKSTPSIKGVWVVREPN